MANGLCALAPAKYAPLSIPDFEKIAYYSILRISCTKSTITMGLDRKPFMPLFRALRRSSSKAFAVMARMGMPARAGFFNSRTWRFGLRTAMQQFCEAKGDGINLLEFQNGFIKYWHERMTNEEFVSFFIAPNMTWRHAYEDMISKRELGKDKQAQILMYEIEQRLRYEIMLEYGLTGSISCCILSLSKKASTSSALVSSVLLPLISLLLPPFFLFLSCNDSKPKKNTRIKIISDVRKVSFNLLIVYSPDKIIYYFTLKKGRRKYDSLNFLKLFINTVVRSFLGNMYVMWMAFLQ